MYDFMAAGNNLDNLAKVANSTEFEDIKALLSGPGNYTFFAPNNKATADIDPSTLNSTQVTQLKATLQYHLLGAEVTADMLKALQFPPSLLTNSDFVNLNGDGQVLDIAKSDKVTIHYGLDDVATVTTADQICSNGVIHTIDSVIAMPPVVSDLIAAADLTSLNTALVNADLLTAVDTTADFTVLAPNNDAFAAFPAWVNATKEELSNILQFHVIPFPLYSVDIKDKMSVTTLLGDNVTFSVDKDGGVSVQGGDITAQVRLPNVLSQNGVVHVIDQVLLPSGPSPPPTPNTTSPTTSPPTPKPVPTFNHTFGKLKRKAAGAVGLAIEDIGLVASGNGVVQRYDGSTNEWTVTEEELPFPHEGFSGATLQGEYFLFAGGEDKNGTVTDSVLLLNTSGVALPVNPKLSTARAHFAGASAGGYALFAGGLINSTTPTDAVDVWYSTQEQDMLKLSEARGNLASAATSRFVLFAGGSSAVEGGTFSGAVDVFDVAERKFVTGHGLHLDTPRAFLAGVALSDEIKDTFLFAGGITSDSLQPNVTDAVDVFVYDVATKTWTHERKQPLSEARCYLSGASAGNLAVFAGGVTAKNEKSKTVDLFDAGEFSRTDNLEQARALPAFFSALQADPEQGEQEVAVFAGGSVQDPAGSDEVDMFAVAAPAPPAPTPASPTPASPTPAPESSGIGAGDVVLIVLGALLVVSAVVYCLRSKKRQPLDSNDPSNRLLGDNA